MDRFVLTGSNLAAVPVLIQTDNWMYRIAIGSAMTASLAFHYLVGASVDTIWDRALMTGLDGDHNQFNTDALLLLDQVLAIFCMAGTLRRFGFWNTWPNTCRTHSIVAVGMLVLGEIVPWHALHVIAHAFWHVLAFTLCWHLEIATEETLSPCPCQS